jgi:diguanylate cyclase (GGDEF)-like protein/PAS domain S-box-containing protein
MRDDEAISSYNSRGLMRSFEQTVIDGKKIYKPYIWLVILAGALICVHSFIYLPYSELGFPAASLALVTIFIASRIVVKLFRFNSSISVSDILIFLAIFLFGGEAAILLGAGESLYSSLRVTKKPLTMVFNGAVMACSTFVTVWVLRIWFNPLSTLRHEGYSSKLVLATAVMALIQYVVNSGLVAVAAALWNNQPIFTTWKKHYVWASLISLAAASAAGIITTLIDIVGIYAIVAIAPIMAIVYFTYLTHIKNLQYSTAQVESEKRFHQAFDNAPIGMALVSLDGYWLQVNHSLCKILGFSEAEMLQRKYQAVVHPADLGKFSIEINRLFSGEISTCQLETRYVHKLGHEICVLIGISMLNEGGAELSHMIFQIQDITDRKRAEERLLYDAYHDALTGLPNRAWFVGLLKSSLKIARQDKEALFAILFLDLDRFKIINDSIGHLCGDQLLIGIAERLKRCIRQNDKIARLGGDEFTILIQGFKDMKEVTDIAERIQEEISAPFNLSGYETSTTASIGIALSSSEYIKPEDLLRDADTAMYEAKSLGKAQYVIFDRGMHIHAMNLLQLETDLRRAIERKEFTVQYQPIVSLETGRLKGFEALVRWYHPERGLISPDKFITVAEETGLIVPLGKWVLEEACKQLKQWERQFYKLPNLIMSVNLSNKQFAHANLFEQISQVLQTTQLDPRKLKLEITESVVMENIDVASKMLERLRALGIELSIDDFGTGYSSLSCLHRLPIDTLKIDRSFISRLNENNENKEIVRTIILLAKNLGMGVIAEGIETKEQVKILKELNCPHGQGYFFSKPMVADSVTELLRMTLKTDKNSTYLKEIINDDLDIPLSTTYAM